MLRPLYGLPLPLMATVCDLDMFLLMLPEAVRGLWLVVASIYEVGPCVVSSVIFQVDHFFKFSAWEGIALKCVSKSDIV